MVINNPNYYDEIAQGYEELHGEEQLRKIEIISKYIEPKLDETLLDVGCGTGISTEPWICKKHGIDSSKKLIEIAKEKNSETDYKVAAAEEIPFEDDQFDYVISVTAVQNFCDIEKGLTEMKRVLKEKGIIVISTLKDSPNLKSIHKNINEAFNIEQTYEDKIDIFFIGRKF